MLFYKLCTYKICLTQIIKYFKINDYAKSSQLITFEYIFIKCLFKINF